MLALFDKRTNFYYLRNQREAYLLEDYSSIPREMKKNKGIDIIDYINEDESVCLTDLVNNGITHVRYENMPYCIGLEDLTYLHPNLSRYYFALSKASPSAMDLLWQEDIYLLVNFDDKKKKFLKSVINKEKLYIAFIDKAKADTFLTNLNEEKGEDLKYVSMRFRLDYKYKYLILDDAPFLNKDSDITKGAYVLEKKDYS